MTRKTKEEKAYDAYLEKSLDEEFLIDPDTGAKITLEQAESGHWIDHSNEFQTMPEDEIQALFSEEDRVFQRGLNYLRASKEYLRSELSDEDIELLSSTHILGKYDDWTYSEAYDLQFGIGRLIITNVEIHGDSYYEGHFSESQILFWLKIAETRGHIFIDENSQINQLVQKLIGNDFTIKADHKIQVFNQPSNMVELLRIIQAIDGMAGLELEIMNNHLFFKNLKYVNSADIERIEKFAKRIIEPKN